MAIKSSSRNGATVRLVVVHSAEGARTAAALGNYFSRDDVQASSHVGIDGAQILQYVSYDRAAWTLRNGNRYSENAELCAFARWTRAQWLSRGVVDGVVNPYNMLVLTAAWIRSRCLANNIPMIKLTAAQVAAGRPGVCGHADYTDGTGDGSHWDPGPNFPWDVVMDMVVNGGPVPEPAPQPMEDIMVRLQRGDSTITDPSGKPYGYAVYMVKFDPELPTGAVRSYMADGPTYRCMLVAQGGKVDVVDQDMFDKIPKVAGSQ